MSATTCHALPLHKPRLARARKVYRNGTLIWQARRRKAAVVPRKVWLMILFGEDLDMLRLHLDTLHHVVDRFLITESRDTFTRHAKKAAVLSDALASNALPPYLASKLTVRIVDLQRAASIGHCSRREVGYSMTFCVEQWQRYQLFEMLVAANAQPHDLALLADTDEIARPEVITALRDCYPFVGDSEHPTQDKIVLRSHWYEFGLHCLVSKTWEHGPHAYSVGHLLKVYGGSRMQREEDGPIAEETSMANKWSRRTRSRRPR